MLSARHPKPLLKTKESGTLQYIIDTITWTPVYNLYLDTDILEDANGILYFMALINNSSGYNIDAKNTILVAGDAKMESARRSNKKYAAQSLRAATIEMAPNDNIEQAPIAELLTYDLKNQVVSDEKMTLPILKFDLGNITKKYIIDVDTYDSSNNQFVEASYGYSILIKNTDFPAGLLRIFAKSSNFNGDISLGSVNISRTPKSTPMEIMLGKTPRIRAKISKEDSSSQIENGYERDIIKKTKFTINKIRINGIITNGTNKKENIIIRNYIGNATVIDTNIDTNIEPVNNMGYLEWTIKANPGDTSVNITYQIRY